MAKGGAAELAVRSEPYRVAAATPSAAAVERSATHAGADQRCLNPLSTGGPVGATVDNQSDQLCPCSPSKRICRGEQATAAGSHGTAVAIDPRKLVLDRPAGHACWNDARQANRDRGVN